MPTMWAGADGPPAPSDADSNPVAPHPQRLEDPRLEPLGQRLVAAECPDELAEDEERVRGVVERGPRHEPERSLADAPEQVVGGRWRTRGRHPLRVVGARGVAQEVPRRDGLAARQTGLRRARRERGQPGPDRRPEGEPTLLDQLHHRRRDDRLRHRRDPEAVLQGDPGIGTRRRPPRGSAPAGPATASAAAGRSPRATCPARTAKARSRRRGSKRGLGTRPVTPT